MKKQHTLPTSNRNLWNAGALLLTLLTAGCTTPEPPALPPEVFYTPPPAPKYDPANDPQPHYTILVESNPPGVRIEFNDAFVGTTPCRIRVPGGAGRKFAHGQMLDHVFKALPPPSGASTQIKRFPEGSQRGRALILDIWSSEWLRRSERCGGESFVSKHNPILDEYTILTCHMV